MKISNNLPNSRLINQNISHNKNNSPLELVKWMGGLQGQDFHGVKWSIALRLNQNNSLPDIENAFNDRSIIRTWPMRGTLFVIPAEDVRWMLQLCSPKNIKGALNRRKALELDDITLFRCYDEFTKALQGGKQLVRDEMYATLESAGISTAGQRGYHILWNSALKGIICQSGIKNNEQMFSLTEEWVPNPKILARDEALGLLAKRYFISHGPATLQDFIWWSGLSAGEAKIGHQSANNFLLSEKIADKTYYFSAETQSVNQKSCFVLPGFDEYILGYKDRADVLASAHAQKVCPGNNGVFIATIVINGAVAGTWKRTIKKNKLQVQLFPFDSFSINLIEMIGIAFKRYANYLKLEFNSSCISF